MRAHPSYGLLRPHPSSIQRAVWRQGGTAVTTTKKSTARTFPITQISRLCILSYIPTPRTGVARSEPYTANQVHSSPEPRRYRECVCTDSTGPDTNPTFSILLGRPPVPGLPIPVPGCTHPTFPWLVANQTRLQYVTYIIKCRNFPLRKSHLFETVAPLTHDEETTYLVVQSTLSHDVKVNPLCTTK